MTDEQLAAFHESLTDDERVIWDVLETGGVCVDDIHDLIKGRRLLYERVIFDTVTATESLILRLGTLAAEAFVSRVASRLPEASVEDDLDLVLIDDV